MTDKKDVVFADLGLSQESLKAVEEKGFKKPSEIQAGIIPLLLKGKKDIIGQSQTGTGKTAAFGLPLLELLDSKIKKTQAIILVPTRELAIQAEKEIISFSNEKNSPTTMVVYGGSSMKKEIEALANNPNIVVGTPGRMQHHIRTKKLKLDDVRYFVLDEADEMLNFGFRQEIEDILSMTPSDRRVLLFSATMPKSILNIVSNYMRDYDMVKVKATEMTNSNISQKYYCVKDADKFEALCRIIENEGHFYSIVFCRTKSHTDLVAKKLTDRGINAEAIHGDIDQGKRENILKRFRERETEILVATDVAARGIDIEDLDFVVNYHLPESYEPYTHRIGRTARAGKTGTAISLINGSEAGTLHFFEKKLQVKIKKENLPTGEDVIEKKKQKLLRKIEHIIDNENTNYLNTLVKQLLEESEPAVVVAALIQNFCKGKLKEDSYEVIFEDQERRSAPKRRGGNRRWGRGGNRGGNRNRKFSSSKRQGGYQRRNSFKGKKK